MNIIKIFFKKYFLNLFLAVFTRAFWDYLIGTSLLAFAFYCVLRILNIDAHWLIELKNILLFGAFMSGYISLCEKDSKLKNNK
jgi:hypothetical protein